jgi:homoserine kinase
MAAEPSELRPARVRVPASTSNLGSGFDCLGLAIARYLEAAYEPGDAPLRLELGGTLTALRATAEDDILARAFRARAAAHGVPGVGGVLRATSDIPLSRGLGSSAAAVVAGLALADAAAGKLKRAANPDAPGHSPAPAHALAPAQQDDWLAAATDLEGHPDNAAPAILGGLVAVARDTAGRPRAVPLPLSPAVGFAFAAPGAEVSTHAARQALPAEVPHAVAARALGRLAALLHGLAVADPELIRSGFADELHVPYRLPLVPGAREAMEAAHAAGAWAVTISGSGSGLIAACAPTHAADVAAAMAAAFRSAAGPEGVVHFEARPAIQGVRVEVEP